MRYKRLFVSGGTYFFTLITYQRKPIFSSPEAVKLLRDAFRYTMDRLPFTIVASVVLPDHLHIILKLPTDSYDYPTRWRLIKSYFTRNWCKGNKTSQNPSHAIKGEKEIWQRRYWEHLIQDVNDLYRHIEYIHYNPVKHGYTALPIEWEYSSFKRYVQNGLFERDWGSEIASSFTDKFME